MADADTTAPYHGELDHHDAGTPDGLYDLRVVTTDKAGNTFTSALVTNVRVDNTAPDGRPDGARRERERARVA